MAAVKSHGSAAMIHLLVARGHTATAKNRYGWTALDFAKQVAKAPCAHCVEVVQLHADNKAELPCQTFDWYQPACCSA
jgi:ankyrin repeat protein